MHFLIFFSSSIYRWDSKGVQKIFRGGGGAREARRVPETLLPTFALEGLQRGLPPSSWKHSLPPCSCRAGSWTALAASHSSSPCAFLVLLRFFFPLNFRGKRKRSKIASYQVKIGLKVGPSERQHSIFVLKGRPFLLFTQSNTTGVCNGGRENSNKDETEGCVVVRLKYI